MFTAAEVNTLRALSNAANDNRAAPAVHRFVVGRTYWTRSACDYDCIFSFTILARTAKTVTVEVHGKVVKRGLSFYGYEETFKPFGSYSMAAVIGAGKQG